MESMWYVVNPGLKVRCKNLASQKRKGQINAKSIDCRSWKKLAKTAINYLLAAVSLDRSRHTSTQIKGELFSERGTQTVCCSTKRCTFQNWHLYLCNCSRYLYLRYSSRYCLSHRILFLRLSTRVFYGRGPSWFSRRITKVVVLIEVEFPAPESRKMLDSTAHGNPD